MASRTPNEQVLEKKKADGFIGKRVRFFLDVLGWIIMALFLSILIEWIGIFFSLWKLPGAFHSDMILSQELNWLNRDFSSVLGSPASTSLRFSKAMYHAIFIWFQIDLAQTILQFDLIAPVAAYIKAALTVVQLFFVRLTIITFSLPVFIFFAIVAIIDGAVIRDTRRFNLDRERGLVWHNAASWLKPLVVTPFIVYLGSPWSIHPNWIILPFVLMLSFALWIVSSQFKKYL